MDDGVQFGVDRLARGDRRLDRLDGRDLPRPDQLDLSRRVQRGELASELERHVATLVLLGDPSITAARSRPGACSRAPATE